MKTQNLHYKLKRAVFASIFVSLFVLAACDSSNALLEPDAGSTNNAASVANLADKLSLTEKQSQEINDLVARKGENEPGTLWYVAAELQSTLTEGQKTTLFQEIEAAREKHAGEGRSSRNQAQRRFRDRGENFEEIVGELTEEQEAQLKELREKQREKMKALVEMRRDEGEVNREEMKASMEQMRESMHSELEAILTEEQFAALKSEREKQQARMKERRGEASQENGQRRRGPWSGRFDGETAEAYSAAKIEALGLTSEQQTEIKAVFASQKEKAKTLFEEMKASDEDREALREELHTIGEASMASLAEILTVSQQETIKIHRALVFNAAKSRTGQNKAGKARGRRGSRRFN